MVLLFINILLILFAYVRAVNAQTVGNYEIPWNMKHGEITERCPKEIAALEKDVDEWFAKASADKDTTNFDYFLSSEELGLKASSFISTVYLIYNLHTDEKIRKEAFDCKILFSNAADKISARTDIYQLLKKLKPRNKAEERLAYITLKGLEESGALISDEKKHKEYLEIQEKLNQLSSEFAKNIADDKSSIAFTEAELAGVPENVMKRFEKLPDGRLKIVLKDNDYLDVFGTAELESTRKSIYTAVRGKVGMKNIEILKKILELRQETAELLGYKNWAEVQTSNRMAKNPESVFKFYDSLKPQFFAMRDKNLARLKKFVGEQDPELKDKDLAPWNADSNGYFAKLYKKKHLSFDEQKVREYFPRQKVIDEMLKFYQELFSIKFKEIDNKNVWHPTVQTYEILDGKKTIAYFYLDLEPREGKYSHQAVMNYRTGYKMKDGTYRRPISVMMGNMTPEKPGAPALLSIREVETLFHEFGHVMHGTLTKAPYSSLAGTNVYRDFVEAPSQMLENWVYTDALLNRISSHYKTGKKIPKDLVKKMKENKSYNSGIFYSRQLLLGAFDMTLHTQKIDDPRAQYAKMVKEYAGVDPIPDDTFPAPFGHLMGYSAGYYSYLWSIVFAEDMFSKFEEKGVMNKALGMKYRKVILEPGNMHEPMELLKMFLGREPSPDAFIKSIQE